MTSCENFLKATQVKEEIEEAIEIANSSPILYHIIADKDSGTVSPSQATLKKKQSVNLLFTPADGWSFICWEALDRNTNEPVPDAIQFENPQKLETKAVIIKPTQNLMIHPKCQLVPKVIEITPKFDNSGCDQDRTIEVVFNKPVNPQTLDITGISITTPEGAELFSTDPTKSFFETPYFSNENKVLNIPTIKGKFLLLPDDLDENTTVYNSKKSTDDITVRLDLSAVKDTDGLTFEQPDPHTYRVNKTVDNVPPVITSIDLFSTSDESDYFYKKLTDKPFFKEDGTTLNWSSAIVKYEDGTTQYQNGDYSQNHVSHIYITLEGHDDRSGLKGVKIRETYKRDTSGTPVESEPKGSELYTSENGVFNIDYTFNSDYLSDGLFLIEVILLDKADKEAKVEYWIIKDTLCQLTLGSTETEISNEQGAGFKNNYRPIYNSETGEYSSKLNFTKLTLNTDSYYDNKKSYRILTAEFCYEGEQTTQTIITNQGIDTEKDLPTSVKNSLSNFVYNPEKTGYLKLKIQDEAGNSDELEIIFPKFATIYKVLNKDEIITDGVFRFLGNNTNSQVLYYYTYQESEKSTPGDLTKVDNSSDFDQDGIYTFYAQQNIWIIFQDQGYRCPLDIFSSFGPAFKFSNGQISGTVTFPDFTLPTNDEITYEKNTAMAKFSINVDFPEDNNVYRIVMKENKYNRIYTFDNPEEIEIDNGAKYNVWLIASDSEGKFIAESSVEKELDLTKTDNIPPAKFDQFVSNFFIYIDSDKIRSTRCLFKDKTYNTELSNTKEFYPEKPVEFYFVPKKYGSDLNYQLAVNKAINNYSLTITNKDKQNGYYEIPYDIAGEECYLYFRIIDNSPLQNETFACAKSVKLPVLYDNIFNVSVSGSDLLISTEAKKDINVSIKYLDNVEWKNEILNQTMTRANEGQPLQTYTKAYNTIPQKFIKITNGYMRPLYVYPDYHKYLSEHQGQNVPAYCKSKSWFKVDNGRQIYCDKPCFVHTLYSSKNLTQTGNFTKEEAALEWETRAQETGLVYNDGTGITFSYTDDNLAGVPSGYYYTTICHFADGTVVMSEVKQK